MGLRQRRVGAEGGPPGAPWGPPPEPLQQQEGEGGGGEGCFLGIYVSTPHLRVVEADIDDTSAPGTLHFELEGDELLVFGTLRFFFQLHNSSSFSLSFLVEEFNVFYYPIGTSRQCLLYHTGTILDSSQQAFQHREKFATPTNHPWAYFSQPDNQLAVGGC
ncbi:hypothetical protein, conserved [Eimeria brunetti]|uniref:Uncharacterized protein n=1 Tax=Eimeria brunetti TaxID=51314 RepID=U6LCY0_9EIME|nr:hypothetical protein, conserved [Eimeria brunetti]